MKCAVGCGVCDTPELWRGAAGLCARARTCAGAAESSHAYIHTARGSRAQVAAGAHGVERRVRLEGEEEVCLDRGEYSKVSQGLSLNKTLFYFKALLWESFVILLPPPAAKPTLLQHYCTTIAQHTRRPPTPPFHAIHHTILVMAISCKGQVLGRRASRPSRRRGRGVPGQGGIF